MSFLRAIFSLSLVVSPIAPCFPAAGQTKLMETSQQVYSPQTSARKLTLAQAIDAAEANYPRVRIALERRNAAQAGIGVARSAYYPRADVLWQTNRATADNIYGLLLPQPVIPSISGPVIASDTTRSA